MLDLEAEMSAARSRVDTRLDALLHGGPPALLEAMRYTVLAPGKRLRPLLCLWSYEMWRDADAVTDREAEGTALDIACAFECVHAYSLVHDDLPCMDDDALRRGRPTCHVVFGEAMAVLVGDALLNLAYETLLAAPWADPDRAIRVSRTLARAASHRGLLGGQVLDLQAEGEPPAAATLEAIHGAKTGALIRAALVAGGQVAGAPEPDLERLDAAGTELGLAFQIADDILDVTGRAAELGKSPGKDAGAHKMTYPALHGLERARELARAHADAARTAFAHWPDSERLQALAHYCVERVR